MARSRAQHRGRRALALVASAGILLGAGFAAAQQSPPIPKRIWDIPLGTHVSELPTVDFVDPACGTNGGPPGKVLGAFTNFAECALEAVTGLREVWFIYDDEGEYIAKAKSGGRDLAMIARAKATQVFHQPVLLSFLINDEGIIDGYRIFTDSRAEPEIRIEAYAVAVTFRARFGLEGWVCEKTPPDGRRTPIMGTYAFEFCSLDLPDRRVEVESHHYFKPGQAVLNPFNGKGMVNEFESWARLEIVMNR